MNEQIKSLRAEADRLEHKATLLAAYDTLRTISGEEFRVRQSLDFPAWSSLMDLEFAVTHACRDIAVKLGHNDRVKLLVLAGMDRERAEISDLITDEDAAACFATWLFDSYGRYTPAHDDDGTIWFAGNTFPLGLQFWKEGKHDT